MKRPRMSASDSDYSIDWLASDEDDNDSELELGYDEACTTLTSTSAAHDSAIPQTCRKSSSTSVKVNEDRSSRSSSPSSSTSSLSSEESVLTGKEDQSVISCTSGSPKGKGRQAQKRTQSLLESEQKEKQLTDGPTQRDKLFAYKCMELQCYIDPLSSILNGLRSGRYRERLSTFQESVAMDRIQRIMGVLQNPCMGERYINIILKMEEMLKTWFPQIKPHHQTTTVELMQETVLHKKPKLSSEPVLMSASTSNPCTTSTAKAMNVSDLTPPASYTATNLKWLHTSPICSPTAEHTRRTVRNFLTARQNQDVMQDNSVSSTIDTPESKDSVPCQPPQGKISAPCLERLLKSTESIISHQVSGGMST
ncbi:circadian-associated transcriptional repressor [Trichomycterus rosablanca]|uniref:circadian-associated transcriptional repressor n=1 Tax=Trichomycterus rosablanca TaxID=2290929 RepID=UPI002F34F09F